MRHSEIVNRVGFHLLLKFMLCQASVESAEVIISYLLNVPFFVYTFWKYVLWSSHHFSFTKCTDVLWTRTEASYVFIVSWMNNMSICKFCWWTCLSGIGTENTANKFLKFEKSWQCTELMLHMKLKMILLIFFICFSWRIAHHQKNIALLQPCYPWQLLSIG